jgi:hypothetical protein
LRRSSTLRAYLDNVPLPLEKLSGSVGGRKEKKQDKSPPIVSESENTKAWETLQAERDILAQRVMRLEAMLADPEKGQNAILYFRLRAIWAMCHSDLMALSRQFQEKYTDSGPDNGNDTTVSATSAAHEAFTARRRVARARVRSLQEEQKRINYELHGREKPFRVGEKSALSKESIKIEKQLDGATRELTALQKNAPMAPIAPPPSASSSQRNELALQTRRAINITLIALAQYFYLFYREDQIAAMALRASRKPVEDANFGLASECLALGSKVRDLATLAKNERNRHEDVRQRVKYLKHRLRYASNSDAIPDRYSVNTIPVRVDFHEGFLGNRDDSIPVNVLALNYWDVNKTLLK